MSQKFVTINVKPEDKEKLKLVAKKLEGELGIPFNQRATILYLLNKELKNGKA
jgi:hypothetical protein